MSTEWDDLNFLKLPDNYASNSSKKMSLQHTSYYNNNFEYMYILGIIMSCLYTLQKKCFIFPLLKFIFSQESHPFLLHQSFNTLKIHRHTDIRKCVDFCDIFIQRTYNNYYPTCLRCDKEGIHWHHISCIIY